MLVGTLCGRLAKCISVTVNVTVHPLDFGPCPCLNPNVQKLISMGGRGPDTGIEDDREL